MKLSIFVILSCFLFSSCEKEIMYDDTKRIDYHFYSKKSFAWAGLVYSVTLNPNPFISKQLVNSNSYDVTVYVKKHSPEWYADNIIYKIKDLSDDSVYMSATITPSYHLMNVYPQTKEDTLFIEVWDVGRNGCSKKMWASFKLDNCKMK